MALNDILTSMDGARDALVTAINAKGGSLADSATLYQCADAVGSLSGEYYKCTSVNTSAAAPQGSTLTMHQGFAQWVFHLQDASATGDSRVWVSQAQENYTGTLLYLNKTYQIGSEYSWAIRDEANSIHYYAQSVTDQPWDNTTMFDNNIMISSVSVTWDVSQAVAGEQTWSGYKAVFDSTAGTWSFESDSTAGLTYTSVTPIVGSIYSADALARIQSLYQGEPSGLIFRAPLASDLVDIVGGVQGESWGTAPVYGKIDGKDCVTTNGTGIKFTFDSAGMFEDIWSPRTIMLWFRKAGGSGWKQIYSPPDNINIREANSTVHYGKYGQESTVSISNNIWYHHAFTVTENNIKWYIDGVLKTNNTSWTPDGLLTYFSLATWSGTVGESPGGAWSGQIADVRIYNRVLDAAEIQQIYEA